MCDLKNKLKITSWEKMLLEMCSVSKTESYLSILFLDFTILAVISLYVYVSSILSILIYLSNLS